MVCFQRTRSKTNSIKNLKKSCLEINYSNHLNLEIKQRDSERLHELSQSHSILKLWIQNSISVLLTTNPFIFLAILCYLLNIIGNFFLKILVSQRNGAFRIQWIKTTINNWFVSQVPFTPAHVSAALAPGWNAGGAQCLFWFFSCI